MQVSLNARQLLRHLDEHGVETIPLYQPLHQSEAHAGAGGVGGRVAEALYAQTLTLPSSISLAAADQDRIIDLIVAAGRRARSARTAEVVLTP